MTRDMLKILLGMAIVAVMVSAAQADVISNTFSMGYGFTGTWNDTETSSFNTDVTGDFTLSVAFVADTVPTNFGCTFGSRTLTNGISGDQSDKTTSDFSVTVTGAYTGDLSIGSTKLVIDSISIYAYNHSGLSNGHNHDDIRWWETTTGNTGTSDWQNLGTGITTSGLYTAANFDQLDWNPGDVAVAGTSSARVFKFNLGDALGGGSGGFTAAFVDGVEVVGHIVAVPEPSAIALLGIGGLMMLVWRRRRTG